MRRINFIEIANLCFHFTYLRKKSFDYLELRSIFSKSRIYSFHQSFNELIEVCNKLRILVLDKGTIKITPFGLKIAHVHKFIKTHLELDLKEYFIKQILFNLQLKEYCAAAFLNRFQVDASKKTFVYERTSLDTHVETNWLINLSSVGLIEVDNNFAFIKPEYLEITNILLRDFRFGISKITIDEDFRNKIGDFAEDRAMEFEKNRLKKNGLDELSKLIQQISKVDKYAGYDILSFSGKGKFPEENIYIEVKGTTDDKVKFIWTSNEIRKAKAYKNKYFIYSFQNINLNSSTSTGPQIIKNPYKSISENKYLIEPTQLYIEKK